MAEIPCAIYRLSSILGDSRSGRVGQFNHVHQLMRLFPQNVLPIMPAEPAAPVDLIATDWVIPALAHLFDASFTAGSVVQLCAGRDASLTVREVVDLTRRVFERHPLGRRWHPIRVPDFVPLAEFERYVERHRHTKDRLFGELLRILGYFLPASRDRAGVREPRGDQRPGGQRRTVPLIREYYERIIAYGLDTGWAQASPARQPGSA